jgi:hypothetical protein
MADAVVYRQRRDHNQWFEGFQTTLERTTPFDDARRVFIANLTFMPYEKVAFEKVAFGIGAQFSVAHDWHLMYASHLKPFSALSVPPAIPTISTSFGNTAVSASSETAPTERDLVFEALNNLHYKWRTIRGISEETGLDRKTVADVLSQHKQELVRSSRFTTDGRSLYTTRSRFREFASFWTRLLGAIKNQVD